MVVCTAQAACVTRKSEDTTAIPMQEAAAAAAAVYSHTWILVMLKPLGRGVSEGGIGGLNKLHAYVSHAGF